MSIFNLVLDPNVALILMAIKNGPKFTIDTHSYYLQGITPDLSSKQIVEIIDLLIESKLLHYCHKDGTVEVTPDGSFIAGLLFRIRRECEDIEESLEV